MLSQTSVSVVFITSSDSSDLVLSAIAMLIAPVTDLHLVCAPQALVSNVTHVDGCAMNSDDKSGFPQALAAVSASDAVVMVMGLDPTMEYVWRNDFF